MVSMLSGKEFSPFASVSVCVCRRRFCIRHLVHDNHFIRNSNPIVLKRYSFSTPQSPSSSSLLFALTFCSFCQCSLFIAIAINTVPFSGLLVRSLVRTRFEIQHTESGRERRDSASWLRQSTNTALPRFNTSQQNIIYNVSIKSLAICNICRPRTHRLEFNRIPTIMNDAL